MRSIGRLPKFGTASNVSAVVNHTSTGNVTIAACTSRITTFVIGHIGFEPAPNPTSRLQSTHVARNGTPRPIHEQSLARQRDAGAS